MSDIFAFSKRFYYIFENTKGFVDAYGKKFIKIGFLVLPLRLRNGVKFCKVQKFPEVWALSQFSLFCVVGI